MNERDLYPKFSAHIRDHYKGGSASFELKIIKRGNFNFNDLQLHQERALLMTGKSGVYHKISDQSMNQKPFDSFLLKGKGYLVLFYKENPMFLLIEIEKYIKHRALYPDSKSLSFVDACHLSGEIKMLAESESN